MHVVGGSVVLRAHVKKRTAMQWTGGGARGGKCM